MSQGPYVGRKKHIQTCGTSGADPGGGGGAGPFIVASGKKLMGGAIRNLKKTGIDFYSGFRENAQGGGGCNWKSQKNVGIDFYSGFRTKSKYILL